MGGKIALTRAKMAFLHYIRLKMDQIGPKMAKNSVFVPKIPEILFAEHPPSEKITLMKSAWEQAPQLILSEASHLFVKSLLST